MPLGSTDMGNVTQVMPGIHPIVGIDARGASVHQPAFAAAAAGPSADKAVVEGAIMLARTVVALAETPAERDRVLELPARRVRHEHCQTPPRLAGRPLRRRGGLAPAHPRPPRARAGRSSPPHSSSRRIWPMPGLNPKVLPGGTGLICDFGPEHGPRIALRADMDALPMADRTGMPYASVVPERLARLRPRRAHRGAAGHGAGAGVGARAAGRRCG